MTQEQRDQAMFDLIKEMLKQQNLRDMEPQNSNPQKITLLKKILERLKHYFAKPKKENFHITSDDGFSSQNTNY